MAGGAGGQPNGEWHEDLTPVWNHLALHDKGVLATIAGDPGHPNLDLPTCIRAIHAAAIETKAAIGAVILLKMFHRYPDGAFWFRVDTKGFEDDVHAIWEACLAKAREKYAGWPEPVEFEAIRERSRKLGPQHMPPMLWPFIKDTAERMGVATSSVALAAIVSCSAVISEEWLVQPKRRDWSWTQAARLWGAVVGPPSVLKSPVIRACTKPIIEMEQAARTQYADDMRRYKAELNQWKKDGQPDPEPEKPRRPRYLVESTTVEALQEVLRDDGDAKFKTPAGKVLVLQDELGEFLGNMDKYQEGKGGDRGAYLRLYDGGPHSVDRINRGSFTTRSWSGCLLGGIQPDVIQKIAKQTTDDGLLQRFLFDVPSPRPRKGEDRAPDYPTMMAYRDLFPALAALRPARTGELDNRHAVVVMLHEQAHASREEVDRLIEVMGTMDTSPRVRSTIGKWPGLFGRLCLTFHLIEIAAANLRGEQGPVRDVISPDTADRVAHYMIDILAPNLLRADAVIFHSQQTNHAGWIAGYVLARKADTVTAREIVQHYKPIRAPEEKQSLASVMESLCLYGWMIPVESTNPYRPPSTWTINPRVHLAFAKRAEEERAQKQAAHDAILQRIADWKTAELEC